MAATTSVRVYRYGLLAPTVGGEIVEDQIRAAHRYQNTLIEIERSRREAVRVVMAAHDTMAAPQAVLDGLLVELEAHRTAIKARRQNTKTKIGPPEERERSQALREQLRAARVALKLARGALRADVVVAGELARVNAEHHQHAKVARASCGVYWGTYLQTEQAMDAARKGVVDPRFRRWSGEGAVSVQLQGGLSVDGAVNGTDTRLRLALSPRPVPGRGGKAIPRVLLRVGSDGRAPVWAEWPMIYHRPLPEGGSIKWAKVVRRKTASRDEWSLHLTVEIPEPSPGLDTCDVAELGTLAVDLGWRREGDTLRAGGWANNAGQAADIMLDPGVRGMLRKAEDLRSIRDKNQNALAAWLIEWRKVVVLDDEHSERVQWLGQWKSPGRFAGLALWWREHRIDGDAEMFERLEAWRKRDKHLWLWEAHARKRAILRRRDRYRSLAAQLASTHGTLVIERLDIRALAAIPAPESERESNPSARAQRVDTAPSELRQALEQAFRARGGLVVTVAAGGSAAALLASYIERSGVVEKAVGAVSKFKRLRAEREARTAVAEEDGKPLESGGATE